MNLRKQITQFLAFAYIFTGAYMTWRALGIIANTHSPIVVVLTGSMEPAFQRGDVLFLWNRHKINNVGDVVVYETSTKDIPIVHRVLREHHNSQKQYVLTKGDNNLVDDLSLYGRKKSYLTQDDIIGTVYGYVPKVGYITILLTENQYFRFGIFGLMALSSLFQSE